jgi:hypothetical protein
MTENTFIYPIHQRIQYSNDTEFRQSIRSVFGMNEQTHITTDPHLDEISKDEMNFDDTQVEEWTKWVSMETAQCYELQELYKLAAATMMSLDTEIGLAVLFSFDYFKDFHSTLCAYFADRTIDLDMLQCYERLWNRLSTSK